MRGWPSIGRSLTLLPPHVFDGSAGVCVCLFACMLACVGAVSPRLAVALTTRPAASESALQPQFVLTVSSLSYRELKVCVRRRRCVGNSKCHQRACSTPASASACVCSFVGAVAPQSEAANGTRRAAGESPHRGEARWLFFSAGVNVVGNTEGVRAPPSVGRSVTLSPLHVFDGASVRASACLCIYLHARAQHRYDRRWESEHGEQLVSAPPSWHTVFAFGLRRNECRRVNCGC